MHALCKPCSNIIISCNGCNTKHLITSKRNNKGFTSKAVIQYLIKIFLIIFVLYSFYFFLYSILDSKGIVLSLLFIYNEHIIQGG